MSRGDRAQRVVERAVGLLLRVYPRRFRRRFGPDVLTSVRDELTTAAEAGWTPLARTSARELGDAAAGVVGAHRAAWAHGGGWRARRTLAALVESVRQDARLAVRALLHARLFTGAALAILGLGIGATTAIFSVVDAVVLRGLPFDEADRLVAVLEHDPTRETTFGGGSTTQQNFLDWRRLQEPFEAIAIESYTVLEAANAAGEPVDLVGRRVSHEFFDLLRVEPLLGRTFVTGDERPGNGSVVVLSYGFWQGWFGGDHGVIGRTVDFGGEAWRVIGVLPRRFVYPVGSAEPADVFVPHVFGPSAASRENASRNYNYLTIGRLKPRVSLTQASDQMVALAASLDAEHPDWYRGRRARVVSLHERLVGRVRTWMVLLLGAVVVVLLIACANVANLMLVRATTRAHELAIRGALGAGRGRLARSLLVESLVLAGAGTALGVLIGTAGVELLRAWLPPGLPRVADIGVDWRVLGAAAGAAVATGLTFGLVPAVHGSRADLRQTLGTGGRSSSAGRWHERLRGGLVVTEVALATVLLVGAGLFLGSFVRLISVDPGFDYRNLLVVEVSVPFDRDNLDETFARGRANVQASLDAVRRVPGVLGVEAVMGGVPLTGSWSRSSVQLPGDAEARESDLDIRSVSPGYVALLQLPLVAGRPLAETDDRGAPPVIVVNQAAASRYWPGADPLGQRITVGDVERTVVGVVGDIRHLGPETPPRQEAYKPLVQSDLSGADLVIKTAGEPEALLPAVKAAIWRVNPDQRFRYSTATLEGYMDGLIARRRFNMTLLALFGGLGLVIALAGIYGVMAYAVAQRTAEFSIRLALGATPGRVVSMVLGRTSRLVATGLAIGGAVAWSLSDVVRAFLFQVEPSDPRVFATAILVLALTGLVAGLLPARRAAGVDPARVLRQA